MWRAEFRAAVPAAIPQVCVFLCRFCLRLQMLNSKSEIWSGLWSRLHGVSDDPTTPAPCAAMVATELEDSYHAGQTDTNLHTTASGGLFRVTRTWRICNSVPYGCTELRIKVFPIPGDLGSEASRQVCPSGNRAIIPLFSNLLESASEVFQCPSRGGHSYAF
jgi:hypothetical protein